jgi:hypothetical protein
MVFSEPVDRASAASAITITAGFRVDAVWSADNTTLFLSAAGSPWRGPVNITIGTGLTDRAGNHLETPQSFTYEMGRLPEQAPPNNTTLALPLALAVAGAAFLVLFVAQRAKKQREDYVERMRRDLEERERAPAGESVPADNETVGGGPRNPI